MVHNETQDPRPVIQSGLDSVSESDLSAVDVPENVSTDWGINCLQAEEGDFWAGSATEQGTSME